MNGVAVLMIVGVVVGCATFVVAAAMARRYARRGAAGAPRRGWHELRGIGWLALAACGAFYVYTSMEFMARVNESQAEITRRKTIVASLDRTVGVYRKGLKELETALSQARSHPEGLSPDVLTTHLEQILSEIRRRERASR